MSSNAFKNVANFEAFPISISVQVLLIQNYEFYSLGGTWHSLDGSPTYPSRQAHLGTWLRTLHTALIPQVPGQGSLHFWLMQALFDGHSLLRTHSGLQERYGSPWKPGRHLQAAARPSSEHSALSPHGLGSHGLTTGSGVGVAEREG